MSAARAQLEAGASAMGLRVPAAAIDRFERYLRELLTWRRRLNLIAATDGTSIVGLHFLDSLLPLAVWSVPTECRVVDVGSGAGFPGIPMKIVRPDLRLTLVETSRRRVAFLEHVQGALDLHNVEILWDRAEAIARSPEHREAYGLAVERAAARFDVALELCLPFVEIGGAAILLKGPRAKEEVGGARPLVTRLGGTVEACEIWPLPTTDRRRVAVVVRKTRPTPTLFPRRTARLGQPI